MVLVLASNDRNRMSGSVNRVALPIREMPTILRIDGYRFFFFSNEGREPPHVHVESGQAVAKFWLRGPVLVRSHGFSSQEIARMHRLIVLNLALLEERWHEYFDR